MEKLSSFQQQVLTGLLLGNGSLQTFNQGKTYRFRFLQSEKRKDYVFHVYEVFKDFIRTSPKLLLEFRQNSVIYRKWYVNTLTFSVFQPFYKLFYVERKKKLSFSIESMIEAPTLAYWFMDNGSRKSKYEKGFRFCTEGFEKEDVIFLQKVLEEKFHLQTVLVRHRQGFRIFIKPESHDLFVSIIKPYVLESFQFQFN